MKFQTNYSIKDLEKLSGIKAHTLRIWEKRYALFEPSRTKSNIRFYTNDELKRILNISLLNKHGFKISKIASMKEEEIARKASELNMIRTDNDDLIDSLIVSMIDLNESLFDRIITSCILKLGFENTMQQVITAFFKRIGIMWQTGGINPAQEHFISNIVRQKLIVAIDGIKSGTEPCKGTALLFLPEHELHELGLLFLNYVLRVRNYKTIYLGQIVPLSSLIRISEISKPDFLVSIATVPFPKKQFDPFIEQLRSLPGKPVTILGGMATVNHKKKFPSHILTYNDLKEFLALLPS